MMAGLGWLVFSSITGWVAYAVLCMVVFMEGWPTLVQPPTLLNAVACLLPIPCKGRG